MLKYLLTISFCFVFSGLLAQLNPIVSPASGIICSTQSNQLTASWNPGTGDYTISYDVMDPNNTSTVLRTIATAGPLAVLSDSQPYNYQVGDLNGSNEVFVTIAVTDQTPQTVRSAPISFPVEFDPTVNAGADLSICQGDNGNLSGSATNFSSLTWTTLGDGSFSDPSAANPTYTPGTNDIATMSVTLTLTAAGNGPCSNVSDEVVLSITPAPTLDAGIDRAICEGADLAITLGSATNVSTVFWTTSGDGTFNSTTVFQPIYTPGPNDVVNGSAILTITANGNGSCTSIQDFITLTIDPTPNAGTYIGNAGPACSNETAYDLTILLDGSQDAGGSWSDDNASGALITGNNADFSGVATDGGYDFTYTVPGGGSCTDATTTVTVNITLPPNPGIPTDATICSSVGTVDLFNQLAGEDGSGSWSKTGGTGTGEDNGLLESGLVDFTTATAGSYIFSYTELGSGPCPDESVNVTINVTTPPNAGSYAGTPGEACTNTSAFELNTLLDGTQDAGGTWSDVSGSGATISGNFVNFNGVAAGTYFFEYLVSNGVCADANTNVTVNIAEGPTLSVDPSIAICKGEFLDLSALNPAFTIATGVQWTTSGDGVFSPDATSLAPIYTPGPDDVNAGSFDLTVSTSGNGICEAVSDNVTVTFKEIPEVILPVNKVFYQQNGNVDFNKISDQIEVNGADAYSWSIVSGEGTFSGGSATSTQLYPTYTPNESNYPAPIVLELVATNTTTACPTFQNFEFIIYDNPDYEALINLFEVNNGQLWADTTNWLRYGTSIGDWAGITVNENNRVVGLSLPSNGINDISALEPMAVNLTSFNISNNKLNFEQLQPFSSVADFSYTNQEFEYQIPTEYFDFLGAEISIEVAANASSNTYQWFKDSVQITGETNAVLLFNNVQRADQGFYYLEINNESLPELTFYSNETELKVSTLERDVAALKVLYEQTGGSNWGSIEWDTTIENPSDWSANAEDIIVENNRVVEVNLPENNLTGEVPRVLKEILGLRALNLPNNAISSLPDFSALPNMTTLDVSGNALGYEDLEPNATIADFTFNDQANFGIANDQKKPQGSTASLAFGVGGENNTYQWYRNNEIISGANSNSFSIDSITYSNMGEFQLEVRNSIINALDPEFKLLSNPVRLVASADLSGRVSDANDFATESGSLYLFKYISENELDSVRLENGEFSFNLQADGIFNVENVELGDYILYVDNDEEEYPDLLNTYFPNTIDWEFAEVISLRTSQDNLKITMEGEPAELQGTSVFSGFIEQEVEESGRLLPRRRVKGAGVSVRTLAGSSREIGYRSMLEEGELVAYIETDENGEFVIPKLPAGRYSLKCNVAGVPMDQDSDIIFELTGEKDEALEVSCVWDEGKITVNTLKYTANEEKLVRSVYLHPNPSNGRFMVSGIEQASAFRVLNANGTVIKDLSGVESSVSDLELDLSNHPEGIYFMQIIWKDGFSTISKLLKE